MNSFNEVQKIKERYDKRSSISERYNILNASSFLAEQERERALIKCLKCSGLIPLEIKKVLEIGAGCGINILLLLKLGFKPENIVVNELIPEKVQRLNSILPSGITILEGDASELDLTPQSFDIIFQSLVFTSILDQEFKKKLASKIWQLAKPGGGVIWYDFMFNNPKNPDVKGVKLKEIKELFPDSEITRWRLTLAPPLVRALPFNAFSYIFLSLFSFLQTHQLCWIRKK